MSMSYVFEFHTKCQVEGRRIPAGATRELSKNQVQAEIDLGQKEVKNKDGKFLRKVWLSPFLLHATCVNADIEEDFGLGDNAIEAPEVKEEKGETIEEMASPDRAALKTALDKMGIEYAKNTPTTKLEEMVKAAQAG